MARLPAADASRTGRSLGSGQAPRRQESNGSADGIVTTEASGKKFDTIRFVREARARIHEETKDMSSEEFVRWLRSRRPTDPRLAALKARKVPPESTRPPAPRSNP